MPIDHNKIIKSAANTVLQKEGLSQKGNSRIWIDDNGWYLTVVEFQPSVGGKGCYLNVAVYYLWDEKEYFSFDFGGRVGNIVKFSEEEETLYEDMAALSEIAMKKVREYRKFRDPAYARRKILRYHAASKSHELYHKMMICGLCGTPDAKKYYAELSALVKDSPKVWEQKYCLELTGSIAQIIEEPSAFRDYILEKVAHQRRVKDVALYESA